MINHLFLSLKINASKTSYSKIESNLIETFDIFHYLITLFLSNCVCG